jgi:hypothetical protein
MRPCQDKPPVSVISIAFLIPAANSKLQGQGQFCVDLVMVV